MKYNTNKLKAIIQCVLIVSCSQASAEPIIIKDYGTAKPIGWAIKDQRTVAVAPRDPMKSLLQSRWPLTTELKPGKVITKPLPAAMVGKLHTPIFIIGSDKASRQWLIKKKPALIAIKAKGVLVESPSHQYFKQIAAMAKPLTLEAIAIDDIADELGLTHYPVIVSNTGVEQ